VIVVALTAHLYAERALAEIMSFDLLIPNAAINAYPAPFANVNINRTDATHATVTFQSSVTGGYQYLMGDGSTVALNVNASGFTVGSVTESNSLGSLFTPAWKATNLTSMQVDGLGPFNLTIDNQGGFKDSATRVQFTLTNTGGSWANGLAVLLPNSSGYQAAAHIFLCPAGSCDPSVGALATGYAAGLVVVPVPAAFLLFGSGLLGLAGLQWHRH